MADECRSDVISDLFGIIEANKCCEYRDNITNGIKTKLAQEIDVIDDIEIIDDSLEAIAQHHIDLIVNINKLEKSRDVVMLNKCIDRILFAKVKQNNSTILLIKIIMDNFMILSLHPNIESISPPTILAMELIMRCILECIHIRYQSNDLTLLEQHHAILYLLIIANQTSVISCNFTIANTKSKHEELLELRKINNKGKFEKIMENVETLLPTFNTAFHSLFNNFSSNMIVYLKLLHSSEYCIQVATRMLTEFLYNLDEENVTNIFICVGKFWHELENSSNVDVYTAHIINNIIHMISKTSNHNLSSASIAAILPICLRLCNRYSVNEQILGLHVLRSLIEVLSSSTIMSISSWLLPQVLVCLKSYTDSMPTLLCIRILNTLLTCSTTSTFCKHYYHVLIDHIVSSNFNNTSNLPLYFAAIEIWNQCPLEILLITANRINEFSLKLLNVWHLPTQIISIYCLTILIHHCDTKLEYLLPKITVEFYRVILFYERNDAFDIAGSSKEQIDSFVAYVKHLLIYIKQIDKNSFTTVLREVDEFKNVSLEASNNYL